MVRRVPGNHRVRQRLAGARAREAGGRALKAIRVLAGLALALAASALWLGRAHEDSRPEPAAAPRPTRATEVEPARAEPRIAAPVPAPAPARSDEPPAESGELPWDLDEIARRYREAENPEERTDALLELGLSDDPRVLEYMLRELERADAARRESLIAGVVQFGSREAVPRLRALAARAPDDATRRELLEAADYLSLPSLSELRRGELELEP